jgi:hypothetical protein
MMFLLLATNLSRIDTMKYIARASNMQGAELPPFPRLAVECSLLPCLAASDLKEERGIMGIKDL